MDAEEIAMLREVDRLCREAGFDASETATAHVFYSVGRFLRHAPKGTDLASMTPQEIVSNIQARRNIDAGAG